MARIRDEAARRRVLDSARTLVCDLGPRVVTVDAIAAAAGVGKQTIYRWWPTKSAVLMDALAELTDPERDDLPASAYEDRRWWDHEKEGNHINARAWTNAGWKVDSLDVNNQWVKFVRAR